MQLSNDLREHPTRKLGFGSPLGAFPANGTKEARRAHFMGFLKAACASQSFQFPVLDTVTIHYGGPLTDSQVNTTFGTVINPLGANPETPPPGALSVDTTFAQPGEFQRWVLICGIQWRFDFEPHEFTVLGNSWTAPASGEAIPVSPDDFNVNAAHPDTAVSGPLALATGETMVQSALEWGWWSSLAAFYQTRAYNLQWQWGNRELLLNDQLRFTAYSPSNAMDGSASNSDVDVDFFVRRSNDYYRNQLAAGRLFLTADRSRIGNMTLGGNAGLSVFRPTRAYEFVGATMGGIALRQQLRGNMEFRRLSAPILMMPGVPIGLKAVQGNTTGQNNDATLMRQYLSATYGFLGATPTATFTPDVNINTGASTAGTAAVTGAEPSLDTPVAPVSQQLNGQREIFKGGTWKLTVGFKGFELTQDQANSVSTDPELQRAIQSECGCSCAIR